jgi:DEAD/DEAH box helicase domain-containing protein
MLPSLISREVEEGVKSFLRTTFPPSNPAFEHCLKDFLDEPGKVFKGPYFSLRLPFRPAPKRALPFEEISFPFRPHVHQASAFKRLCGIAPRSTLVATGTGSGKTECFLYPLLDACAARIGEPGIKAIVIYPMNALATDQAKRFAKAIHAEEKLRGKVTAGLFIGGEGDQATTMAADWLITNKGHMREHPPDILLTNYKMLDYLLLRPQEQSLWRENAPESLRFLVVDELHTFDGAQATDLACLIRRLKARLRTPAEQLCCVGTSATLGSQDSINPLLAYAREVFAEPFDESAVINEDLLAMADVVDGYFIRHYRVPGPDELTALDDSQDVDGFVSAHYRLWFDSNLKNSLHEPGGRIELGERLREHSFFRNLLTLCERSGRKIVSEDWLSHELAPMLGREQGIVAKVLDSFLSLCVHARYRQPGDEDLAVGPLLRVHSHLWTRELSRLVASVGHPPRMAFSDDLKEDAAKTHLPVMHCRECGAMGWGGTMRANTDKVSPNLQEFYKAFFGRHPSLRLFFPLPETGELSAGEFTHQICGYCLAVNPADAKKCTGCGLDDKLARVLVHDRTKRVKDRTEADTTCPYCEGASGLTILGSRAASLTSVALGQLFTSPFNLEKKALAFSDNVQDASHRSGFFAARTYRVNLRTAIFGILDREDAAVSVHELEKRFLEYWRDQLGNDDFIALFLAPNMEWLNDYESLRKDGRVPPGSNLLNLVERRTAWEITAEFGFNSRIGRTLEKSGAAIAFVDSSAVARAASDALQHIKEKAGGFGVVAEKEVLTLLQGLIHRLRTAGGVIHPEMDIYLKRGGDTYLLNQQVHMPSFGNYGRAPSFFTMGPARFQRFEKLAAGGTSLSWSQRWAAKALKSVPKLSGEASSLVLEIAVKALTSEGIFKECEVDGSRVWGIPTDQLWLSTEVRSMKCGHCGHGISCPESEESIWTDAPCLRPMCRGVYIPQPPIEDYFGDLYRKGDVVRIRSTEHTGLLSREDREWVENRFMARPPERRGTDPNLLSCTPTLEMGVNIGDLATVVLCTVPPATANYVQRVGRAGRKEGAAFSLTIASAQSHDLYFFELPEDMMSGEIRPPGTFLDAPAVLERQFTAFCMDRWSEQTNPKPVLPHKLDAVLNVLSDPANTTGFPHDFFHFIDANLSALLSGFLSLFTNEELTPASRTTVEVFASGDGEREGGLAYKINKRLNGVLKDRDDLRARFQKVGRAIRKNRDTKARDEVLEEELDELKQARDGIHEMLKQINSKITLNFFTDEGLLPNYAFPEEGIELRSVILKKREKPGPDEGKYQAVTYEYMRPANSGITELAPGSVFYVGGRRLKVDQIGMGVSPVETWHFCDTCGHMEIISAEGVSKSECPACGSPNWADASLRRDLIRLRQVVSTTIDSKSRSHDDSDQREQQFFNRHESVVIPDDSERIAYQIRGASVPFGFEFLAKLVLRVVNLGQDDPATHSFRLGGREVSGGGFVLCPECGKLQTKQAGSGDVEMKHDLSCRFRGKDATPLKAVFLYRELHSEAIRILLPSSGAAEDTDMTSFVASLHLGLRLYFRGSIDHLKGCVDERPVSGTNLRRKYLVLYDQVPGGTGYLKQLSRSPGAFMDVLRLALKHLTDCECATRDDHDTDGCHRCILQARHRRDHANLSRRRAISLLKAILENADQLEQVSRVSEIDIHPLIKSQLEKDFLESLRAVPASQLQAKIVRGKPGYLWRCADAAWEIAPQVGVPAGFGSDVHSIPDFVLYPVRSEVSRPVAVFLDGFTFHADERAGRNRVARDVEQRQSLLKSGNYWVWNFSWEDIQYRNDPSRIPASPLGEANAASRNDIARQFLAGDDLALAQSVSGHSSWTIFLEFLQRPSVIRWIPISYLYALALPKKLCRLSLEDARGAVNMLLHSAEVLPAMPDLPTGDCLGAPFSDHQIAGLTIIALDGIATRNPDRLFFLLHFDDDTGLLEPEFPRHWRGFLRLMNRLQFLSNVHFLTTRGVVGGAFPRVVDDYLFFAAGGTDSTRPEPSARPADESRLGDLELVAPALVPFLNELISNSLPWPEIGFENEERGLITATAEAAWPDKKLALLAEVAIPDQHALRAAGWTVFVFSAEGITPAQKTEILELLSKKL